MSAPPCGGPGQRDCQKEAARQTQTGDEVPWVPAKQKRRPQPHLRGGDWSVPVVDVGSLATADGVALASLEEAERVIAASEEWTGAKAVVVDIVQETIGGKKGHVTTVVTTRGGRTEAVKATIIQLGDDLVNTTLVKRTAAMPADMPAAVSGRDADDKTKLSVRIPRRYTTAEQWQAAAGNLKAYIRKYASDAGVAVDLVITGEETCGKPEDERRYFGALVRAPEGAVSALEAASGKLGVFVARKADRGPVIWLKPGTPLEEAMQLAPGDVIRVCANRRGLGLRVEAAGEEKVRREVGERAGPVLRGRVWDVNGFHPRTTAAQAETFLRNAGWADVTAIRTLPKRGKVLAVVRGGEPPAWVFEIEGTGTQVLVSMARHVGETEQRWVQAAPRVRRKDPSERGTEREQHTYTRPEFVRCYGPKHGGKLWKEAGTEGADPVLTTQGAATAGGDNDMGVKVDDPGDQAKARSYADAVKGSKGNKKGKQGKPPAVNPQAREEGVGTECQRLRGDNDRLTARLVEREKKLEEGRESQRVVEELRGDKSCLTARLAEREKELEESRKSQRVVEELRGDNNRLTARLVEREKELEESRKSQRVVEELQAENTRLARKVEELTTLLQSLREQVENARPGTSESRSASPPCAPTASFAGKRRRGTTQSLSKSRESTQQSKRQAGATKITDYMKPRNK
ncbi:hypothetical protein DIPPA_07907 [Diplonema papillatum]|nr:hypothetical protein DIPPA_16243 [Diplonema papillatum]KAJ9445260.1 hypothetical protein DIPPA_07907 [Diplonema papillatum]